MPNNIFRHRSIFRNPAGQNSHSQDHARPDSSEDVIRRFTELLGSINGTGVSGRNGPQPLFGAPGEGGVGGPQVRVTRFQTGPYSGVSSFTIATGSSRTIRPDDPFQSYDIPFRRYLGSSRITLVSVSSTRANRNPRAFGDIFGRAGDRQAFGAPPPFPMGPDDDSGGRDPHEPPRGPAMDFPGIFQHLLATVLNPNAVHGDAVTSQEELDRIITNLMEANPQSNAPPPATEETIAKLPRKKLDENMLPDGKGECTICIDDVSLGDEVVVLPCKHWFHDECVVLWLKEHNTCPICRSPVEGESAGQPQRNDAPATAGSEAGPSSSSSRPSAAERRRSNLRQSARDRIDAIRATGGMSDSRSASQRRSSNSPPMNPPLSQPSARVRSPSPSSRRSTFSDRNSERSGGSGAGGGGGPFHWFRDAFGRNNRS